MILHFVDLENAFLCGFLKIKKLTKEFPELTTYFDGEIICRKHPFATKKWEADEETDRKHWVSVSSRVVHNEDSAWFACLIAWLSCSGGSRRFSIDWFIDWLSLWLIASTLIDWSVDWLIYLSIYSLIHSFINRSVDGLVDGLIHLIPYSLQGKFPSFLRYSKNSYSDSVYEELKESDFIFMRWKEHFLGTRKLTRWSCSFALCTFSLDNFQSVFFSLQYLTIPSMN